MPSIFLVFSILVFTIIVLLLRYSGTNIFKDVKSKSLLFEQFEIGSWCLSSEIRLALFHIVYNWSSFLTDSANGEKVSVKIFLAISWLQGKINEHLATIFA